MGRCLAAWLALPLLAALAACGGDSAADPCQPDEDGYVHLGDIDDVLACDFSTDVRTVIISSYKGAEVHDYVPPDTTGMDEREIRLAKQEAMDAMVDSSTVKEWNPVGDQRCTGLGGSILQVGYPMPDTRVCMIDDAEIPALDAWRP